MTEVREVITVMFDDDLQKQKCATPGCLECDEILYFGARCHPHAPVTPFYVKSAKVLHLACGFCGQTIAGLAVAERQHSRGVVH